MLGESRRRVNLAATSRGEGTTVSAALSRSRRISSRHAIWYRSRYGTVSTHRRTGTHGAPRLSDARRAPSSAGPAARTPRQPLARKRQQVLARAALAPKARHAVLEDTARQELPEFARISKQKPSDLFACRWLRAPATMNGEGLADAAAANPFRSPRLHPGSGRRWGSPHRRSVVNDAEAAQR